MISIVNGANKHNVYEQLKSYGANKLDYVLITCLQKIWQSVLLIPKWWLEQRTR